MRELFEAELKKHNLNWCKGECGINGHKRGFVLAHDRTTVHLSREVATRSTLHRALHEIGHCINNETGLRSYEKEAKANQYAVNKMREWGISVPRKTISRGVAYVQRKKRHGDAIRRNR
jgi:hypothetical protein